MSFEILVIPLLFPHDTHIIEKQDGSMSGFEHGEFLGCRFELFGGDGGLKDGGGDVPAVMRDDSE